MDLGARLGVSFAIRLEWHEESDFITYYKNLILGNIYHFGEFYIELDKIIYLLNLIFFTIQARRQNGINNEAIKSL